MTQFNDTRGGVSVADTPYDSRYSSMSYTEHIGACTSHTDYGRGFSQMERILLPFSLVWSGSHDNAAYSTPDGGDEPW